jgi:hypothetical protein
MNHCVLAALLLPMFTGNRSSGHGIIQTSSSQSYYVSLVVQKLSAMVTIQGCHGVSYQHVFRTSYAGWGYCFASCSTCCQLLCNQGYASGQRWHQCMRQCESSLLEWKRVFLQSLPWSNCQRFSLYLVCSFISLRMVQFLWGESICLCLVLQEGWTPLHLAVQGGRTDIINLLVARGADPAIQNKVMQLDHTSSFSPYIIYLFIYLISKFIYLLSYIILIENGCESHGLAFWINRMEIPL